MANGDVATFSDVSDGNAATFAAPSPFKTWRASDSFGVNDIVLDPNGTETIDGLTTMRLYPNEIRLIMCDGTNLKSVPLRGFVRHFQTTSDFYLPSGYSEIEVMAWGGGGAGGSTNASAGRSGGGGGAAACVIEKFNTKYLNQTIRVTVGAGAIASTSYVSYGGNTKFGNYLAAQGGQSAQSGGTAGNGAGYFGFLLDSPLTNANYFSVYAGAQTTLDQNGKNSIYGGASGGWGRNNTGVGYRGGFSFYGSGGGGAGGVGNAPGGVGGGRGHGVRLFAGDSASSNSNDSQKIGGAPGVRINNSTWYNADTVVPFGCGGGGGSCGDPGTSATFGRGAKGGLGGGGGGGNFTDTATGVTNAGAGGDGFLIVRGII